MKFKVRNIIGESVGASDGSVFSVRSPFEEYKNRYEVQIPNSTADDLKTAICSAQKSFEVCQSLSIEERRAILHRAAEAFSLDNETLEIISALDGMPIRFQREKIYQTKRRHYDL